MDNTGRHIQRHEDDFNVSMGLNTTMRIKHGKFISTYYDSDISSLNLVLRVLISIIIIAGNSLVIFVSIKNKMYLQMNRRILLSLSFVDLATGVFGICWVALDKASGSIAISLTTVIFESMWCCVYVSEWHLLVLAGERYLAVVYPFRYLQLASTKRVNLAIALAWMSGTIIGLYISFLVFMMNDKIYAFLSSLIFQLLAFICLCFCHMKVYIEAKHQVSKISSIENQLVRQETANNRTAENRATKTTMLVFGAYLICYFPYIIYIILSCINYNRKLDFNPTLLGYLVTLIYANSGMNPVIYSCRNKVFMRNAIDSLLRNRRRETRNTQIQGSDVPITFSMDLNKTMQVQHTDFRSTLDALTGSDITILPLVLRTLVSVIIIAGNSLVVFVSIKNKMYLQMNWRILLSLSIIDLATGVTGLAWIVLSKVPQGITTIVLTIAFHISMWCCIYISELHLLVLAGERYIAVVYPFRYLQLASTKRVNLAIALVWMSGTMLCLSAFVNNRTYFLVSIIFKILAFIGLSFSHMKVYIEAKHQVSKISSIENQLVRQGTANNRKAENRATKTTMLVFGAYLICYFPNTIYIIRCLILFGTEFEARFNYNSTLLSYLVILMYANSAMNPIIYSWRNRIFMRSAIDSLLRNRERETMSVIY
ncbi:D(1C) dopamine receptor-like [Anneissia japonica]|uniref:D(1C) dopamine receptor-like n=1 Tax=Anneissia japonica TaxID=1529436 RepID=UPI001425AB7A|nr:D(1C) dopamine receptor-like [Anneissia japonica]